ncbi:DUF6843 domain-containing protein [Polaribacter sp. IC063]|uniref:DUF6843 domain-containing protein n=1 Tax=Polaribacter sp. IC063 TaxID=57031 RepID=UPI0011BDFE62|nr:hypothetical protein [Polaribacter sp. IC063]TXD47817.1 hypothetical protein ES043_18110 [Polaribacter sp. IC063]
MSFILFINCKKSENTVTLIPENYVGTIKIRFNEKNGIEKKYENDKRIYEIPENGILKTKFNPQFGYHFPEYYYISENGKRTKVHPILNLNKNVLDTIDKNKIYVYNFMILGGVVKVDSIGNVTEKRESEIIFDIGNPLN